MFIKTQRWFKRQSCVSGRVHRRSRQSQRTLAIRRLPELQARPRWSVFKELRSKKTLVPPRDNRRPLKNPTGHPACRPFVPWRPAQLSTSCLVRPNNRSQVSISTRRTRLIAPVRSPSSRLAPCLRSLSSQHAVQQQSGVPHPGARGAAAQPHVP